MSLASKDYYTPHMKVFDRFNRTSYTSIEVLPILKGKPWDDVALGYCHALRPSSIRVTEGGTKCDARTWRVTVFIDDKNIINKITQEVEVGLPKGVAHGHALRLALQYGIDSSQVRDCL